MAFKTTIKVALLTGAAKDDYFTTEATGLSEEMLKTALNVLGNDPGSAQLYSLQQDLTGAGQMAKVSTATSALGANIKINTNGTIDYNAIDIGSVFDSLAEGEFQTDTFYYTVRMANGALSTALVTLQIAGVNDAPTLGPDMELLRIDDDSDPMGADFSSELLIPLEEGQDVDKSAVLKYSLAGSITDTSGAQILQTDYFKLTLTTSNEFVLVLDTAKIDGLAQDIDKDFTCTFVVTDEHDASDSQNFSISLFGANDTAEITGNATGTVTEDGTLSASGKLLVSDRDEGQSSFAAVSNLSGTYGDFTFDANGAWSYTLRNGENNVQALGAADHPTDTLKVYSLDGSASQDIVVKVNGMNEPAAITGNLGGTVTEDFKLNTGGKVQVTGIVGTPGTPMFKDIDPEYLYGSYGAFKFDSKSGDWSYDLNNNATNVQALGNGGGNDQSDRLEVISQDGTLKAFIEVMIFGVAESSVPPLV